MSRVNLSTLRRMKAEGEKIVSLTAYDASFARIMDSAGVDVLLVGDSLGNVVQGRDSTNPVTVDDMVYHTAMVRRGAERALVMADMPFLSHPDVATAVNNAARLMQEGGAHMVKLEVRRAHEPVVRALADNGVPVCVHLGLLPQSVHKMGGYKIQGREEAAADAMVADAQMMEAAGADLLIVECIPAELGKRLAESVSMPVIGIGAGADTDGQVLVSYDMLGITSGKLPSFVHNFMTDTGSVADAVAAYVKAVREKTFPSEQHSFQ